MTSRDSRLGHLLAHGRTAEIYAWGDGRVLKLFHPWFGVDGVEYEVQISKAVQISGLRVPEVGDIVEVNGRLGIEYERIDGVPMATEIAAKPWALGKYARMLASLHADVHATSNPGGLPALKDRLESKIGTALGLDDGLRKALLKSLSFLPRGEMLCHGDFHPGNIILAGEGPIVIDWIDASFGSPTADVARTSILINGQLGTPGLSRGFERLILSLGHRLYLKEYARLRSGSLDQYRAWLPIVAAARLEEGIEELAPWLRSQAQTLLSKNVG